MKHRLLNTLWGAAVLFAGSAASVAQDDELTLYTQRHYAFDEEIQKLFTEETGIKISVVKANADELITRLQEEGENTPADLYMTADGGTLSRAAEAGLLQPIQSEKIMESVPKFLRDPDGRWVAITQRARVIVHSKDQVKPEELSTYENLADPSWRGRVVIRSSSNSYNQSLMTTIIAANGAEEAEKWAAAVRKNMARPPQGSDRDQIRAIAAGLADVAVVNTYYLGLLETSEDENDRNAAAAVKLFFPNQGGRGTHVNISGIGIVKGTEKADLARQFIEFLLSDKVQNMISEATFEYPASKTAKWSKMQEGWGRFESDEVSMSKLGELNPEAIRIFNRAGWE